MSCERIDPKDFNGPAAAKYTLSSLEALSKSPNFKSYVRHVEYNERLYLTWFIAPFVLFCILSYHVAAFGTEGINLFIAPADTVDLTLEAAPTGMIVTTVLLLLYAIPCTVLAPFVGFFEEPGRWAGVTVLVFLTCVNAAVVAFGGSRLHHPPFLTTMPPVTELIATWNPTDIAVVVARDILVRRALCLEGFILAGYAVSVWRKSFWRRAWHPPLPLLTIPLTVGVAGAAWWAVVDKTLPLFVDAAGSPTSVTTALHWSAVRSDPVGAASLCWTVGKEVARRLLQDGMALWEEQQLPFALRDGASCLSLYLAAASMAALHGFVLLAKPVLDFIFNAFFFLLPTDPTIWGLTLVATIGFFASLWRAAEGSEYALYLSGLAALAAALLFNGFIA